MRLFKKSKKRVGLIIGMSKILLLGLILVGCQNQVHQDIGEYSIQVSLSGGSGRTSIMSPTVLTVEPEQMIARIEWSSANYDLMIVEGESYEPIYEDGHSIFYIPVRALDEEIKVQAETVAMSKPHMIDYLLYFDSSTIKGGEVESCIIETEIEEAQEAEIILANRPKIESLTFKETMPLEYANQFVIDLYEEGYQLIATTDKRYFLVIPEGKEVPKDLSSDIQIIKQPISNIYLAATASMGLFDALDTLEYIRFSSVEAEDWCIENAKKAMEVGDIIYAGKYRSPDYERLLSGKCELAIESSMIDHVPEVREKLEELGILVFVDRSSYEEHPLGRCEWIKVYGSILGKEEEAEDLFKAQIDYLKEIENLPQTKKQVAFFYINSAGQIVTRRSGDYISKMINLAGGENILYSNEDINGTSTMTMEMEYFYQQAKEADILIYNSTIDGEIVSIDELIDKMPLLSEFKAVKQGNVFCTKENLYQETMKIGEVIKDMHKIFNQEIGDKNQIQFLYQLEKE